MPDLIYAVTRVHNQEARMLDRPDVERLLSAETTDEALRLLRDKGWGAPETEGADALLAFERERTWTFVEELVGGAQPFRLFRLEADYHNLKVAIKLTYLGQGDASASGSLMPGGMLDPEQILKAVAGHDFSALPADMAEVARAGYEALMHTGSGQALDAIVDAGALVALDRAGKASPSRLMREYARLRVDAALVRIACRAGRMGMRMDFLETAIPPVGSLNRGALIDRALTGLEAVLDYIGTTKYGDAAQAGRVSLASMERWFDDRLMEAFRAQRYVYDGIEPIAAYLIGREREIETARLILSAKRNRLAREKVLERLRALYV